MQGGRAEHSAQRLLEWPPPLDDSAVIEALTVDVVAHERCATDELVAGLRGDLSARAKAVFGVALVLRERHDAPLRALLATAQDLLDADTDETCENVVGILRSGWTQGLGELLAAARML